jgi:hypothetical protein
MTTTDARLPLSATGRDLLIPLSDGTRLAAHLSLPKGDGPFPVLASFYPYRKDDFIGASCAFPRSYFEEAGYATLLVDVRGYGASDGPSLEGWDPQEARDGAEVVEWAARQPWCDGAVGIWGTSYGGAQALGIAAERPPSLKAIASIYGAADIYEDFVYPGGCPNGLGASAWSAFVLALELAPPGKADPEGHWRDAWRSRLDRLDSGSISSLIWPAHPAKDDYWQRRVIAVEQIEAPSFFMSGWRDLLCRGTLDAYRRCRAPKQLLAGPWSHAAPDSSTIAPYDWLLDLRRWFDRWLKGEEVPARPPVVYQVQGRDGWRGAQHWPPEGVGHLEEVAHFDRPVPAEPLAGVEAGLWYPMGVAFPDVLHQEKDDARALCVTSEPLAEEVTILGEPIARLTVEAAAGPSRHLCVKLCAVAPNDRATLISSGWLRLDAETLGTAEVVLYATAFHVPAGHRLRWTIAAADFPRIWPSASTEPLMVRQATFTLPTCGDVAEEAYDAPMPEPGLNRAPWITAARPIYSRSLDVQSGACSIEAGMAATIALPDGGTVRLEHTATARLEPATPQAATIRTVAAMEIALATGERFQIDATGLASLGRRHLHGRVTTDGALVYERNWTSLNGQLLGAAASK